MSGDGDGFVRIFSVINKETLTESRKVCAKQGDSTYGNAVNCVKFSPNGSLIVCCCRLLLSFIDAKSLKVV